MVAKTLANRAPIVIFGAGSIVGDAHLPAYRKAGFPVAGLYDPNAEKAGSWPKPGASAPLPVKRKRSRSKAPIFDLATPPATHAAILSKLPEALLY
jgi:predicted dehydrogenase